MKFYATGRFQRNPPSGAIFPCAVLAFDNWNDFGVRTLRDVCVYRTASEVILNSSVKILSSDPSKTDPENNATILPLEFDTLDDSYCSLGQDLKYYEQLRDAGAEIYEPYLRGLRDVVFNAQIGAEFRNVPKFGSSFLRFSEAEKAFREAPSLFSQVIAQKSFVFQFWCRVPGAQGEHRVDFDFSEHPTGLYRTAVLIGRNGTGKTQFLARFALAMSGLGEKRPEHGFLPNRPSFSRVIAVSYSVFDDFSRPSEGKQTFSYKYCGICAPVQTLPGEIEGAPPSPPAQTVGATFLSQPELRDRLQRSLESIREQQREASWASILSILLEGQFDVSSAKESLAFYDGLSSGQRILVAVITDIVAHIVPDSIVLWDEPELHLHPEIFSALARAFDHLLNEFDSYAIIATHAPLLLQETTARQVRVFDRTGNIPRIAPLTVESFGENLTVITDEVFAMPGSEHNYRAYLTKLAEGKTVEEVEAMFPQGLPLQARAFLRALRTPPIPGEPTI